MFYSDIHSGRNVDGNNSSQIQLQLVSQLYFTLILIGGTNIFNFSANNSSQLVHLSTSWRPTNLKLR